MYKFGDKVKALKDLPDTYSMISISGEVKKEPYSTQVRKGDIGVVILDIKPSSPRDYVNTVPVLGSTGIRTFREEKIKIDKRIIGVAFKKEHIDKGVFSRVCDEDEVGPVSVRTAKTFTPMINNIDMLEVLKRVKE